jgi:hypothetical protein
MDSCYLRLGPAMSYCEHGNEPSGFIKDLAVYCVNEQLIASLEGLSYMGLISWLSLSFFCFSHFGA